MTTLAWAYARHADQERRCWWCCTPYDTGSPMADILATCRLDSPSSAGNFSPIQGAGSESDTGFATDYAGGIRRVPVLPSPGRPTSPFTTSPTSPFGSSGGGYSPSSPTCGYSPPPRSWTAVASLCQLTQFSPSSPSFSPTSPSAADQPGEPQLQPYVAQLLADVALVTRHYSPTSPAQFNSPTSPSYSPASPSYSPTSPAASWCRPNLAVVLARIALLVAHVAEATLPRVPASRVPGMQQSPTSPNYSPTVSGDPPPLTVCLTNSTSVSVLLA